MSAGGSEEGTPRGLLSPTLKSMRHSESMLHMQPLWEENPNIWQVHQLPCIIQAPQPCSRY